MRNIRNRSQSVPVVGIDVLSKRPEAILVTTRDSRVRLYENSKQTVKFKGHRNKLSRIAASFSPDGVYVISGSDDGSALLFVSQHSVFAM